MSAATAAEPYIDARQLAELIGVSPSTVKRLVAAGMPSQTWGLKRTRRFLASDALAWASSRDSDRLATGSNAEVPRLLTTAGVGRTTEE